MESKRSSARLSWAVLGVVMLLFIGLVGLGGGLALAAAPVAGKWLSGAQAWVAPLVGGSERPVTAAAAAQSSVDLGDAMTIVEAEERVLDNIYTEVLPSVVHLQVTQRGSAMPQFRFELPDVPGLPNPFNGPNGPNGSPFNGPDGETPALRGEGSGFVWDENGHVVTNNHVVTGAEKVEVVFADGTSAPATVLGADPSSDLAVVKIDVPAGKLAPVELGDSDAVRVGQMAVAIGNPFGLDNTMTAGIVSAVGRTIPNGMNGFSIPEVIQTDAPINPGNSGGPLLDRMGRVIGINTQIVSRSGSNSGIGFAVPVNIAKQVVPTLIQSGRVDYAWLGIEGTTLTRTAAEAMDLPGDARGALVVRVIENGPAAKAGLRGGGQAASDATGADVPVGGDVIVAIDGQPIDNMDDLISHVAAHTRPGERITVDVIRAGGDRATLTITLEARPDNVSSARPGTEGRDEAP